MEIFLLPLLETWFYSKRKLINKLQSCTEIFKILLKSTVYFYGRYGSKEFYRCCPSDKADSVQNMRQDLAAPNKWKQQASFNWVQKAKLRAGLLITKQSLIIMDFTFYKSVDKYYKTFALVTTNYRKLLLNP